MAEISHQTTKKIEVGTMNSSFSKITITLTIISISLALSSCESALNQNTPASSQPRVATSQANNTQRTKPQSLTYDQKLVQLAKEIPGFGGLFINQSGQLSIYMTHPTKQKAKAAAVLSSFTPLAKSLAHLKNEGQKYQSASVSHMAIKKGQYTFLQLYAWKGQIRSKILSMKGVYSDGIDESQNQLSIGVKDKAVKAKVSKKLAQLNIPGDAVTIFKMSKPTFATSLRDEVDTYSGGIKISMSQGWCTMGPPVKYRETASGPYVKGWITASHCTPPVGGGVHGVQFYQPILTGNYAGIEVRDPPFTSQKCWQGNEGICRQSDAALISYTNYTPYLVTGGIYKTTSRGHNHGSRTISERFHVKYIDNFILQGVENNKIGARTGWTYGNVSATCVDETVITAAGAVTVVCQNVVQAGADHGDSGSPVFETTSDPDAIILDGVLSGIYTKNGNQYFWYSSVTRIKTELSGPNVHDLTFVYYTAQQCN